MPLGTGAPGLTSPQHSGLREGFYVDQLCLPCLSGPKCAISLYCTQLPLLCLSPSVFTYLLPTVYWPLEKIIMESPSKVTQDGAVKLFLSFLGISDL